ncbi:NUDIX hydrolase [Galbibacter pacificus]|uniref:CoA pyrophosphatase n=1 Tax=Galbibacter pacificus TaxID=2996052 RepID=A0ABT6FRF7_9FLAO|nr:CoA pyrophosphatase [Galbibacter pacificus]MDG3581669.1 CoA pyrophosphatase [Galbibacter pacificus]MDG3585857.1 CoA pyrophosphatase [Galbibacter pacificus]
MKFTDFYDLIPKIKNMPLPGQESHNKMAPAIRVQELEKLKLENKNPRKAGVISLFYPDEALQTRLLLILRKTYNGVHSNQVGFPGGKVELSDKNIEETALRETWEEVGVSPKKIELVKQMSSVYIPPSNFLVQPFIGVSTNNLVFTKQDDEVEEIIEVLFTDFMDDTVVFEESLTTSYATNIEVPAFKLNDYTVWGATAMMLSEVKEMFKKLL